MCVNGVCVLLCVVLMYLRYKKYCVLLICVICVFVIGLSVKLMIDVLNEKFVILGLVMFENGCGDFLMVLLMYKNGFMLCVYLFGVMVMLWM